MALQQFLQEAHRPGSPAYHRWLTPEQFGKLYGPSDSDIAAVRGWLEQQGFSVARVTQGKTAIEFSGTAAELRSAFHTQIHTYAVNGVEHHANNVDPQIPAALAPVIAGVTPMNDFPPKSYIKARGEAVYDRETHKFVPLWTFPAGNDALELSPGDFALQYDLNPLYAEGFTGTGVTIGLIGASNVDPSVVATFRSFFGFPASPLNVVIDGADPGQNDAAVESYLDVELAGAVAPGATIHGGPPAASCHSNCQRERVLDAPDAGSNGDCQCCRGERTTRSDRIHRFLCRRPGGKLERWLYLGERFLQV